MLEEELRRRTRQTLRVGVVSSIYLRSTRLLGSGVVDLIAGFTKRCAFVDAALLIHHYKEAGEFFQCANEAQYDGING